MVRHLSQFRRISDEEADSINWEVLKTTFEDLSDYPDRQPTTDESGFDRLTRDNNRPPELSTSQLRYVIKNHFRVRP